MPAPPAGAPYTGRCVSITFTTVSTYTERHPLLHELKNDFGRVHSETGLAHAVAVVDIGGTGKTPLVLCCIDKRE